MSQTIVLKRSSLPGKVPDTASLNLGEIAINTYDGKLFIKRSGNTDTIQTLVTTNSTSTGSITLTQTGSFGELLVTQDGNFQRDIFVTRDVVANRDIDALGNISGSGLRIGNSLSVTGSNIILSGSTIVTGSINIGNVLNVNNNVITLSGSTSITGSVGMNGDLTVLGSVNARQFNINIISSSVIYQSGSTKFGDTSDDIMSVTGSIQVTGSVTANSFIGNGSGLTNIVVDLSTAQLNDVDGNNIPVRSFAELYVACATADIVDLDFN